MSRKIFTRIATFLILGLTTFLLTGCELLNQAGIDIPTLFNGNGGVGGLFNTTIPEEITTQDPGTCQHEFDTWLYAQAPTCEENGYMTRVCLKCFYVEYQEIPSTGHTYDTAWSYDDYSHYHKSICGHDWAVSDKAEHNFDSKIVIQECSCQQEGIEQLTCSVCGAVIYQHYGKKDHQFVNGVCTMCGAFDSADFVYYLNEDGKSFTLDRYNGNDGAVTIPEYFGEYPVTAIGDYAFYGHGRLTTVEIPDSVTIIGERAFDGCTALTSIKVSNNVTSIGDYAFSDCYSLQNVNIPSKLKYIGEFAFNNCSNLAQDIILPETLKTLGSGAFEYSGIKSVDIPGSLSYIESNTFSGCYNLSAVKIGEGIKRILYSAFSGCKSLTEITIPSTITSIYDDAFGECNSLFVVRNLSRLSIFAGTYDFGRIALNAVVVLNDEYSTVEVKEVNDFVFLINEDETYLIKYNGTKSSVTLGDYLDGRSYYISQFAFRENMYIKNVTLSNYVKGIGSYAFFCAMNLKTVNLSESLEYINERAFSNTSVETIELKSDCVLNQAFADSSISEVILPEGMTKIAKDTFLGAWNLQKVTLPSTVKTIEENAFQSCNNLTEVNLNEGLESIGSYAFAWNSNLQRIVLPSTLKEIKSEAFVGCNSLYLVINKSELNIEKGSWDFGQVARKALVVTKDPNYILNVNQTTDGYKYIDTGEDRNLLISYSGISDGKLDLPEKLGDKPYDIANYVFRWMNFSEIVIPETIKKIGEYAFQGNNSLTVLSLPEGLEEIGNYAFSDCNSLTYAYIPSTLKNISPYAFQSCTSLVTLMISEGVEKISYGAFYNCSSLEGLYLPTTLTSIEWDAFNNCTNLFTIVNLSSLNINPGETNNGYVAYYAYIVTKDPSTNINVYVTEDFFKVVETPEEIKVAKYVGNGANVVLPESINGREYSIGKYAFQDTNVANVTLPSFMEEVSDSAVSGAYNLRTVTLTNNVKRIGECAFENCRQLTEVKEWDSVEKIEERAFAYCESFVNITMPSALKTIGVQAFRSDLWNNNNGRVRNIVLNEGLTTISQYAFYGNTNLYQITIPSTVTSFGNEAFIECFSLYEVINLSTISDDTIKNSINSNVNNYVEILSSEEDKGLIKKDGIFTYLEGKNKTIVVSIDYPEGTSLTFPDKIGGRNEYVIGSRITKGCYINSLILSEGVIGIDSFAFQSLQISSLEIPSSCKYIGVGAFNDCNSLANVIFNEGVENIGSSAFANCKNIKKIELPNSVKRIDDGAFRDCSLLESMIIPESVEYLGSDFAYNTPFYENSKEVVDGVVYFMNTAIGYQDFDSSKPLEIREGTTSISPRAFQYLNINSVIIPEGVKSIGEYAFYSNNLSTVTLPHSLESISSYAFDGNYNTRINFNGTSDEWFNINFGSSQPLPYYYSLYILNDSGEYVLPSMDSYEFKEGLSSVNLSIFSSMQLNSVYIPNSVSSIYGADQVNYSISYYFDINYQDYFDIDIMYGMSDIFTRNLYVKDKGEYRKFTECFAEYGIPDGVQKLKPYILYGMPIGYDFDLIIPDSVIEICENSLLDIRVGKIVIGKNVSKINQYVLNNFNCNSIEISIDNSYYSTLGTNHLIVDLSNMRLIRGFNGLTEIPEGVKTLGQYSLSSLNLTELKLPKSLVSIESGVFNYLYCNSIEIPIDNPYFSTLGTNNLIVELSSMRLIKAINGISEVPEGVKTLGQYSLSGLNLTELKLPESLENIESYAFNGTTIFSKLVIPKNAIINQYAFESSCIKYIEFEEGFETIRSWSFANIWNRIEMIVLPSTLTKIEDYAFISSNVGIIVNHSNLNIIIGNYDNGQIAYNAFEVTDTEPTEEEMFYSQYIIEVDDNTVSIKDVKEMYNYYDSLNIEKMNETLDVVIGSYSFDSSYMWSLYVYANLVEIEDYAFNNCSKLRSIFLPKTITSIASNAFNNCDNLFAIYFNGTEEEWNNISFGEGFKLPENVTIVYNYFY